MWAGKGLTHKTTIGEIMNEELIRARINQAEQMAGLCKVTKWAVATLLFSSIGTAVLAGLLGLIAI